MLKVGWLTTERGSQLIFINSLEELADCTLKNIEAPLFRMTHSYKHDYQHPRIFLVKGSSMYRIEEVAYKVLKHEYLKSGKSNPKVDALIESIESGLISHS